MFGLIGYFGSESTIRAAGVIDVDVTGNNFVGGLVGRNRGVVTASYGTGPVSGNNDVGGLVGENSNYGTITGSYATGRVSGGSNVGGLVGENRGGVTASYATGRVSGGSNVGGLVGENFNSDTITGSYATGRVSGNSEVGGLVGRNSGSGTITASYWDTTTSGRTASAGGAGRSTEALQAPTGYNGIYADWNVDGDGDGAADDAWHFGTSDQYPVLKADIDGDGTATWQEFGHQLRAGPTLTATADGRPVALSWTAVDTSAWVLPPEVTYTVTRGDGTTTTVIDEASSGFTAGDTVVPVGVTHTYQVAAVVDGGEAVRSATVAVTGVPPNRPPVQQGTLPAQTAPIGDGAVAVDVSGAFRDPDGDPLIYGASSSAPLVAAASAAGSTVTVTPLAAGVATIAVTATDAGGSGLSATQTFAVTVPNRPPEVARSLADRLVEVSDGVFMVDVSRAFRDLDGDPLTYGASSSAPPVATVTAAGSVVSVAPLSGGHGHGHGDGNRPDRLEHERDADVHGDGCEPFSRGGADALAAVVAGIDRRAIGGGVECVLGSGRRRADVRGVVVERVGGDGGGDGFDSGGDAGLGGDGDDHGDGDRRGRLEHECDADVRGDGGEPFAGACGELAGAGAADGGRCGAGGGVGRVPGS